ncbi:hypothetical protein HMPREF9347_00588 [Escherichia coli MS 124-1]|nr:hypothetical protein HMPREF9347_00588 [Escherichia coli MS 124-1]EGX25451.1 hypothetical protein ECTX1999_0228 [Escherichia coli TX1999]EHW04610.1 hypothetical protein ECDEC7E_0318 [Escherichia coli DEC7E]EMU86554.1 hypothetical protein ECMP0210176_0334 [Escherichia coli MP021017.6]EMV02525.1 hypothetical protein ECMP0210172_0340 [Escherichia coli MP021017.2]EMV89889.1 hypothetical protein EC2861200_0547 [Escherichia coli 2861200]ENA18678.1 hypothetical protein ECBCE008MS13_0354 [Escherich
MHNCRMRRERLIRPTVQARFVGRISASASGTSAQPPDAA